MAHNRKSPGDVRLRIEALLDPSLTVAEIARLANCNDTYVQTVARINGVKLATSKIKPHAINSVWNDDLTEQLRKLYMDEGKSCGKIAAIMGMSRNAIIGKVHRMNWDRPVRIKTATIEIEKPERRSQTRSSAAPEINPDFEMPKPAPTDVARKPLKNLADDECKWPVGHPGDLGFGFCAGERIPNSPYCHEHHLRAYVPIEGRKPQIPANDREVVEA